MKVLATGMEWFSERPGGLPRYFADYVREMRTHGELIDGLVGVRSLSATQQLPSYVGGVPLTSGNPVRLRNVWKYRVEHEMQLASYDIWNPHFAYYALGAIHGGTMMDIPIVTHFHGPWAFEGRVGRSGYWSQVRFLVQKAIEDRVYRRSDRFIVLSDSFKKILVQDYRVPESRIHVIPGAVDVDRFHPSVDFESVRYELGLPKNKTIVVSVRRLVHRMGIERLIHAVSELVSDFPNLLVIVVGTGCLERDLRRLVEELRLQNHVWFAGRVSDEDLPKYYQSANLSVVPSAALEGFGLITTESLACGTPVVGTPIGGTKEILSGLDPSLIFDGTGTADLINGLGRSLTRTSVLPSALQCRDYVLGHYTWDVVIPQIKNVFSIAKASHEHSHRRNAVVG